MNSCVHFNSRLHDHAALSYLPAARHSKGAVFSKATAGSIPNTQARSYPLSKPEARGRAKLAGAPARQPLSQEETSEVGLVSTVSVQESDPVKKLLPQLSTSHVTRLRPARDECLNIHVQIQAWLTVRAGACRVCRLHVCGACAVHCGCAQVCEAILQNACIGAIEHGDPA